MAEKIRMKELRVGDVVTTPSRPQSVWAVIDVQPPRVLFIPANLAAYTSRTVRVHGSKVVNSRLGWDSETKLLRIGRVSEMGQVMLDLYKDTK